MDQLIDRNSLKKYVPYSSNHILRLEKSGLFPQRIKVNNFRVFWSLKEIEVWLEDQKSKRFK